jgi:hypothetical protein
MSDSKIYNDKLNGVGCDVSNCKYHTKDDKCTAPGIQVESENAMRKAETFCGTFAPRGSSTHEGGGIMSKSGGSTSSSDANTGNLSREATPDDDSWHTLA